MLALAAGVCISCCTSCQTEPNEWQGLTAHVEPRSLLQMVAHSAPPLTPLQTAVDNAVSGGIEQAGDARTSLAAVFGGWASRFFRFGLLEWLGAEAGASATVTMLGETATELGAGFVDGTASSLTTEALSDSPDWRPRSLGRSALSGAFTSGVASVVGPHLGPLSQMALEVEVSTTLGELIEGRRASLSEVVENTVSQGQEQTATWIINTTLHP